MIIFGHISYIVTASNKWRHRLKARTQDFHSCNMGSIPIDATNNHKFNSIIISLVHKTPVLCCFVYVSIV